MFFLDILRFEARLQWRSLRFRVGTALYLLVVCAPAVVLAIVLQPQAAHDFGPSSYLGWVLDLGRFTTLILAMVVAGNRVDEASQRQLWPVLAAAGVSNGGYLWRRWAAMAVLLAIITAIPLLFSFALTTALGLTPYDPLGYLGPWLLFLVSIALMQSAIWLSLITIAGSELGALLMLYLCTLASAAFSSKVLEPLTGSTFAANSEWLGHQQLTWGLVGLLDLGKQRWSYGRQLRSEGVFDLAQTFDWWLARALPHMAFAALLLAVAVGFLRRTRGDIRPLILSDTHPLRNLLRFVHAARARYTPDAALRGELWRLILALLVIAGAFLFHHHRQTHFETQAAEQYAIQTQTEDQPSTPFHLVPTKRSIDGEVGADGTLRSATVIHFENRGEQQVAVISLVANPFLEIGISLEGSERSLTLERREDRIFLSIEPPIAPAQAIDLRVDMRGKPRFTQFLLGGTWGRGASFALRYEQHLRGRHRRTDLARSWHPSAISRRRLELAMGSLTPLVRYTTWQLTERPTLPGESGFDIRWEAIQPVEDIAIDLRLPPGMLAADSCGNGSISDTGETIARLVGQCRTAALGYVVRGGPFEVAAAGDVVFFAQPGHQSHAIDHLPALEEVIQLSASAWPDLPAIDSFVALEWPPELEWGRFARNNQLQWNPLRGWSSTPPRIDGQLMSIPESRLVHRKPISSAELVSQILTRRLTEKRAVIPREQHIFRQLIATAMSRRMGLGLESGATITGKPWTKFWASQPILTTDNRRHLLFDEKIQALAVELIARTGATAFYEGVNAFLAVDSEPASSVSEPASSVSEPSSSLEELFEHLEEHANADLEPFWEQYFTATEALPEMRLGQVDVRPIGDTFLVAGEVQNVGTGRARCPIIIKSEGQSRTIYVEVDAESTARFEVRTDRQPLSALLDPEKVCYRWVNVASGIVERVALGGTSGENR